MIDSPPDVGTRWDTAANVLTTHMHGVASVGDVERWKSTLSDGIASIPDGASFKLLVDLGGYEPANMDAHKAMRSIVPLLLARHGLRTALADLFDEPVNLPITVERGIRCVAVANVHHDRTKMDDYSRRIAKPNQQFFTELGPAEAWIRALPL